MRDLSFGTPLTDPLLTTGVLTDYGVILLAVMAVVSLLMFTGGAVAASVWVLRTDARYAPLAKRETDVPDQREAA